MKFEWELMAHKEPEAGTRFVALYNDGSGSTMFEMTNNDFVYALCEDALEEYPLEILDNYLFWAYLPDGYKFWGEE